MSALPAAADTQATHDTETTKGTVVVTGGALRITAPGDAGVLGRRAANPSSGTVRGTLGQVKVIDSRGAASGSGWVASVVATPLKGPDHAVIPASTVGYSVGTIARKGTATYVGHDRTDLSALVAVVTATDVSGDNTATWTPTIIVRVPGGTRAGTYAVTVTHSVL